MNPYYIVRDLYYTVTNIPRLLAEWMATGRYLLFLVWGSAIGLTGLAVVLRKRRLRMNSTNMPAEKRTSRQRRVSRSGPPPRGAILKLSCSRMLSNARKWRAPLCSGIICEYPIRYGTHPRGA
ncbi:MAG: hypothetical protein ACREHD_10320, partial [Pirellulales bacterium]